MVKQYCYAFSVCQKVGGEGRFDKHMYLIPVDKTSFQINFFVFNQEWILFTYMDNRNNSANVNFDNDRQNIYNIGTSIS